MTTTFARLGLPQPLVSALADRQILQPFPIQAAAIPDALAGRDVSGKAPTGSGKTLAFGLPLLTRVEGAGRHQPRALVLVPTRELAEQITAELGPPAAALGRRVLAVYGGVSYGPQKGALRRGVEVLVATPGRLEDLVAQRSVDLSRVGIVVVDEADRMADMGFFPAVRRILDRTSPERQTLLFSATLDGEVAVLSRDYQRDPVRHKAGTVDPETIDARHHFWLVSDGERVRHAADLVAAAGRSIVFTRTRRRADRVARQITNLGVGAVVLHGGRSQPQRSRALQAFASGRAQGLVATDVAARGIHIDAVASVIHFDPPGDSKGYLHRSGRTARAGAEGTVVSLVSGDQQQAVRRMQRDLQLRAPIETPRLDALGSGGYRMGGPAPARSGAESPAARPAAPTRPRTHPAADRRSVYVANLPWGAATDEVGALFGRHGTVHQTTIVTNHRSGRSRGFGFVEMDAAAVPTAIAALHGSEFGGRRLTVRVAKPRRRNGARRSP